MAQTRPSPTLSRGFTRFGRFLAPYGMQHGQAIRLVDVRGDLGEPTRGRARRAIDLCVDELGCLPEIRDDGAGVVALDSSNRSRLWYI